MINYRYSEGRNIMKRILALAGVVLLLAMYAATFIFAMMNSPASDDWFKASILATLVIPVLLYCYQLVFKHVKNSQKTDAPPAPSEDEDEK